LKFIQDYWFLLIPVVLMLILTGLIWFTIHKSKKQGQERTRRHQDQQRWREYREHLRSLPKSHLVIIAKAERFNYDNTALMELTRRAGITVDEQVSELRDEAARSVRTQLLLACDAAKQASLSEDIPIHPEPLTKEQARDTVKRLIGTPE
jgi:hypothetical protein